MDITKLSTDMAQAKVQDTASVSLLKKTLDQMKGAGAEISAMIDGNTVMPNGVGTKVNLFA